MSSNKTGESVLKEARVAKDHSSPDKCKQEVHRATKLTLAIVTVMRSESRYLSEWVLYYRNLGVDRIAIYDNGDNGDALQRLSGLAILSVIKWPSVEGTSPQMSAYQHAANDLASQFEFIAFFDTDEFLVIDKAISLTIWLSNLPIEVSAIAVNQLVFGSAGHDCYMEQPVTKRFLYSSEKGHNECRWVKSMFRISKLQSIDNCHRGTIKSGRYILPGGQDAFTHESGYKGADGLSLQSDSIDFSIMQLNHYILKSREEFMDKRRRGGASARTASERASRYLDLAFFDLREQYCNVRRDDRILPLLDALMNDLHRLRSLKSAGSGSSIFLPEFAGSN